MAYEAWQPLVAGLFLLLSGGIHVIAPYQAARKAEIESADDDEREEWEEEEPAPGWEIGITQVVGAITALVGLAILVRAYWPF